MKVDTAFPVAGLSGTDRGQPNRNWYRYRGQQVVRLMPVGITKNTGSQSFVRRYFRQSAENWASLTAEEASMWADWATEDNRARGRVGPGITGIAAYTRVNWFRLLNELGLASVPPVIPQPYVVDAVQFVQRLGSDLRKVRWSSTQIAGYDGRFYLQLSQGFTSPNRRARPTDIRSLGKIGEAIPMVQATGPGPDETQMENEDVVMEVGHWVDVVITPLSFDFWPGRTRTFSVQVT